MCAGCRHRLQHSRSVPAIAARERDTEGGLGLLGRKVLSQPGDRCVTHLRNMVEQPNGQCCTAQAASGLTENPGRSFAESPVNMPACHRGDKARRFGDIRR